MSATVRRKKKRRARRLLNLFAVLLAVTGLVLCLTVFFKIDTVTVEGGVRYTADEIQQASGITVGGNLFRFFTANRAKRIEKALPYIDTVKIKRSLPSSVTITVTESNEAALIPLESGYCAVNSSLKIVNLYQDATGAAPILLGTETVSAEIAEKYACEDEFDQALIEELLPLLEKYGYIEKTGLIDVSDRLSVRFVYDGRLVVDLGTSSELDYKLEMLATVLERESDSLVGRVDLSDSGEGLVSDEADAAHNAYPDYF